MRCVIIILVLLVATPRAFADEAKLAEKTRVPASYAGLGIEANDQRQGRLGFSGDAGLRLDNSPLFLRARLTFGLSGADGHYEQLRVGLEGRSCGRMWVCVFAGLDFGGQRDHAVGAPFNFQGWLDNEPPPMTVVDSLDVLLVPRIGIETPTKFRARIALDAVMFKELEGQGTTGVAWTPSISAAYTF
ncbi:MAG TPA: hypothetical protein VFV99_06190 [Kofleriaceae bacterium]|nr:hypothetical protein [Kofleriaceae bacterium]